MDVLVAIETFDVPDRLATKARRIVTVPARPLSADVVADLRAHIPRWVGVVGPPGDALAVALDLNTAGLAVRLYTDTAPE
ncbi:MAG: hypothetical protein M3Y36_07520, partial [Actinomycetota bacterium]|nr:hypothetical protein [Actinomycetota bacterium]